MKNPRIDSSPDSTGNLTSNRDVVKEEGLTSIVDFIILETDFTYIFKVDSTKNLKIFA
jgi:hypothetical protein